MAATLTLDANTLDYNDRQRLTRTNSPQLVVEPWVEDVNQCLAAASYSLKFDIVELWRFSPDRGSKSTKDPVQRTSIQRAALAPHCEHVYAQPATLKTYTGRILGIWNSGFEESHATQQHVLSPSMCEQARVSECPLWFTPKNDIRLHPLLPLSTAVVLPVHLDSDSSGETSGDYIAVFLSLTRLERNHSSLDFLGYIAKAATNLYVEGRAKRQLPQSSDIENVKENVIETHFKDVTVVAHGGEKLNEDVHWDELSSLEFLVSGSRCTIYTAIYKNQSVVVKIIRKDVQDAAIVRTELELELALLKRIRHENVVRLLGAGREPERFLVIARLDGGTLAQRCNHGRHLRDRRKRFKKQKPFSYMELLRCGRQLAEGLRYLHEEAIPGRMVIHRDLKPDNIGFSAEGDLKLLDLGLSKVVSKSEMDDATYNMTGATGSARYMAPEVAESQHYNEKADVYSYGMVLWEMASMKKPFAHMSIDQFFADVVRGGDRPPITKKWPKGLSDLMQACWDEDMNKRPSFAKVGDVLQEMLQEGIDRNLHKVHPGKNGFMSKLGLSNHHSSWF